jgi:Sulfatase
MTIAQASAAPAKAAGHSRLARIVIAVTIAVSHLVALGIMVRTEHGWLASSLFLLAWTAINLLFLAILRRPAISAALSLGFVVLLVTLSQFKFAVLWMVINFFDVLIVDSDTVSFLLSIFPGLRMTLLIVAVLAIPLLVMLWRMDPFRITRTASVAGVTLCSVGMAALSLSIPEQPWEPFQGVNHVSSFVRSGFTTAYELSSKGWIDYDRTTLDALGASANAECTPAAKPPHIVMILDEASFDVTAAPGVKVPDNYRDYFKSVDGQARQLLVESSGGPTWYTEYNVLAGLSARSYGRLSFYVTRIAAGRVERGLPQALRRCGYKTVSLYPAYGAFLSAKRFQTGTGVERFLDSADMKAGDVEPDRFYYDQALRIIESERGNQPLFIFVYTVFNHFPWTDRPRLDLTPDWRDLGNTPEVDEYLRRQAMSAKDYAAFQRRLRSDFPGESFLLVRFGDHQPTISARILEPDLDEQAVAKRMMRRDQRYFTTYYALNGVNYAPKSASSALPMLDAAYLPIVVLEAAGLPLDASFAEQKRILARCNGLFSECAGGAEARRFNRLLIDAGLIKGLATR